MSLILPSERSARVVVPHDQGRAATGFCGVCEVPFYSDRDTRAHLRSGAHRDRVDAAVAERRRKRERLAIFTESADPEVEAHLREVGRRMLREGRLTVHKSERAGF